MLQKRAFLLIILIAGIVFGTEAHGEIINVPDDFTTIQQAIDNAVDGDTVLVAPGTYYENINFLGKNITVTSHYIFNKDTDHILDTVIDGSTATNPYETSTVIFKNDETAQAVLQGFTITGGGGTRWIDPQYPALTWFSGGGVFMYMASPTIRNNFITSNVVENTGNYDGISGGGLICFRGNPEISNNIVSYNEAGYGAGIVVDYSGAIIKNNIVAFNSAGLSYGGGGFYCIGNDTNSIIIENNTIVYNHSESNGGAIRMYSSSGWIANCIVWGNTQNSGSTIHGGASSTITYCDIDATVGGTGNITEDPLFADTLYHLSADSPCVDAGDPEFFFYDREDPSNPGFALYPAMGTITNDMGAYGGPGYYVPPLNIDNQPITENMNFKAYPNPFRKSITLAFSSKELIQNAEMIIYTTRGQRVCKIPICSSPSHSIEATWSGKSQTNETVAPGIYFFHLKNSIKTVTGKIIKLN